MWQQEILSYKIKDIKIYRQTYDTEIEPVDKYKRGAKMVEEELSSISGEKTDAFQAHIIECLEQGNYHKNYGKQYGYVFNPNIAKINDHKVRLRVTFENYENLVWDTIIYEKKNNFWSEVKAFFGIILFIGAFVGVGFLIYKFVEPLESKIKETKEENKTVQTSDYKTVTYKAEDDNYLFVLGNK